MTTSQLASPLHRVRAWAGFVKLEHTIFSLPLIFAGALLGGPLTVRLSGLVLLAAVGGRVMAMGLNRLIDAEIDQRNPRTRQRELPRGAMRRGEAWAIVGFAGFLYITAAAAVAPICLWLSPIPVALFVGYPYLKRVTTLAHLGLGLAWSMAPLGGWLASAANVPSHRAMGRMDWAGWGWEFVGEVGLLWLFSVLWVAGFDIIYATMDEAFDRKFHLHSLPAKIGKQPALRVAALLHAAAFLSLYTLWTWQLQAPVAALAWLAAVGALFIWQHAIAERHPAFAFFQVNGILGFAVLGFVLAGI